MCSRIVQGVWINLLRPSSDVSNGEHIFSESVPISRFKSGAAPTEMTSKIAGSVTAIYYS